jgi:hypothetical protein
MEIDFSLPSEQVIRELKKIISWRGKPQVIRCDNGPEYISAAIQNWATDWGIKPLQRSRCGLTTTTVQTWPWADSLQNSGWPLLRNVSTSAAPAKWEDYQATPRHTRLALQ